jgi:predicted nucleic acid-binding protein
MLVVSDTSPLNYLLLVEAIEVLPVLFSEVFISPAVLDELRHQRAPTLVREWAINPPPWLQVKAAHDLRHIAGLDRGETEAIALAEELDADALLIDERDASRVASQRGIVVIGTFAVLAKAIVNGLIDQDTVTARLARTNFRGPIELLDVFVNRFKSLDEDGI